MTVVIGWECFHQTSKTCVADCAGGGYEAGNNGAPTQPGTGTEPETGNP